MRLRRIFLFERIRTTQGCQIMGGLHVQEITGIFVYAIFFVKDRVDKEEIEVYYCPNHLNIAEY